MIKLSDRLLAIAGRLENSKTMADIGTDHGLLPLYLAAEKGFEKVIMTDISAASLSKASENLEKLCEKGDLTGKTYTRAGDGLKVLEPGEVDAVVIAGMGGKLMTNILGSDPQHARSFGKLVLQPRSGQGHIRKWLYENGFSITCEDLVREGKYICEIITAVIRERSNTESGSDIMSFPPELEETAASSDGEHMIWKVPPWMTEADGPAREFIERRITKSKEILEHVMLAGERDEEAESRICEDIYYLKGLLKEMKNEKNETL